MDGRRKALSEDPPRPAHACASSGPVAMGRRIQGRFPFRQFSSAAGRCRSSVVEHPLGKGEVVSSILTGSTKNVAQNQHLNDRTLPSPPRLDREQDANPPRKLGEIWGKCSTDVHGLSMLKNVRKLRKFRAARSRSLRNSPRASQECSCARRAARLRHAHMNEASRQLGRPGGPVGRRMRSSLRISPCNLFGLQMRSFLRVSVRAGLRHGHAEGD